MKIFSYKEFIKENKESIRSLYSKLGVDNYYSNFKQNYQNPHLENIEKCLEYCLEKINISYFLDLSCGNGEVSSYLKSKGLNNFKGSDPYFSEIYKNNLNKECYDYNFEYISKHGLPEKFDTIICSYALQLCEKSYFNNLLYNLASNCKFFIVISPSKYPYINDNYFELYDSAIINRTHCRIYKSKIEEL